MQIRPAQQSDCPAIVQIHAASWRYAYRGALSDGYLAGEIETHLQAQWQNRFATPPVQNYCGEQIIVVAEEGGELLGFACAYLHENALWGSFLNNIHVKQSLHRSGVGSALLGAVAARCAASRHASSTEMSSNANAVVGLYLFVIQSNLRAQHFYLHHGAKNVGTDMWDAPDGGRVPLYRFAWENAAVLSETVALP